MTNEEYFATEKAAYQAYRAVPEGCKCHDDSGECPWCQLYYGAIREWRATNQG